MGWRRRLRGTILKSSIDEELAEEIRFHIEERTDEYVRGGMSVEEARREAQRRLGNLTMTKDQTRDADTLRWLDEFFQDLRYAGRLLQRNPLFALTAALSLAIGIGANTTIFTIANALLFRAPAGVVEPDRLVDIGVSRNGYGFNPGSYPNYVDLRQRATTLEDVYAHPLFPAPMSLDGPTGASGAERVFATAVTRNYFTVLGAQPAVGRLFDPQSRARPEAAAAGQADEDAIVVLSHNCWTRRFNRDPQIVGQTLRLNGKPFLIVGVAREGFKGTGIRAGDVWMPLATRASGPAEGGSSLTNRAPGWLMVGGRLKPGVSVSQAAAEIDAIGRALEHDHPVDNRGKQLRLLASSAVPGSTEPIIGFLALLMGIVTTVLAIACANLAGVLLARAAARRREIAVRLAIGAGRARLVRQLLTETLMLFVLGTVGGLVLARGMTSLLLSLLPTLPFPIDLSLALDGRAIAFTIGLALVAALLSGLVPAIQASKADVSSAMKDDWPGSHRRSRVRQGFVVAQVALSILLVAIAGLFVRALQRAGSMDPGFDPRGVELASIDLSIAGYTASTGPLFAHDLIARVRQLPDVEAATMAAVLPGGFEGIGLGGIAVPGVAPPDGRPLFPGDWNIVEPDYFATLRMPLVAGRDFSAADRAGTEAVAIIGEGAARRFWPGQDAVGKHIVEHEFGPSRPTMRTLLVVGVARDPKYGSLIDGTTGVRIYVPLLQQYPRNGKMMIVARTQHGPRITSEIRALVASMKPNLPIVTSQTAEDYAALGLVPQRVAASVSGSLGIVGLLLAAIGIYGVTAYTVTRRTREFGIRLALGAQRGDILRMILQQGMSLAAVGCTIGLTLAAMASRVLTGWLYGIPPLDPVTFGGAAVLFAAIGLAACYGPARRATQISAVEALRYE